MAQGALSQGSGSSLQQTSVAANQSNGQAAPNASPSPEGSTLRAERIKPVDARKNKPGDEVLAKVIHDVKVNGGVVIPIGSRLVGHVTEVRARSAPSRPADCWEESGQRRRARPAMSAPLRGPQVWRRRVRVSWDSAV